MAKRRREYPNGYQPKIDYWTAQLVAAAITGNKELEERAKESLKHFVKKQKELDKG